MKIGLSCLGVSSHTGGIFQYTLTMLKALVDSQPAQELVVFYSQPSLLKEPMFVFPGVKYVYIDYQKSFLENIRKIGQLFYGLFGRRNGLNSWIQGRYAEIDKYNCEVIFHPNWGGGAFLTHTPSIAAIHDCAPREALKYLRWQTALQLETLIRGVANHAALILVDSELGQKNLQKYYGVPPEKCAIVPFRPPEYILQSKDRANVDVLQKYGLTPGYFFLPGRWGSYRNTSRVLAALNLAAQKGFDHLNLVLTGIPEDGVPLARRTVARFGLSERVKILGFVPNDDMAPLYREAMALIFPVLLGPTSIPVYEAMALGCPVIVSNISGYPGQVGDAGLLVDPFSASSIAAAMIKVASDPMLRDQMVARGKQRIQSLLAIDYGSTLLNLAQRIVARHPV